jgi:2-iminobutanoate/2-iminopropanoate deaminase
MTARIVDDASGRGSYSPAVVAAGFCYVAGQGPIDRATREIVRGDIAIEASQTLENLSKVLDAAGYQLSDVISTTFYLRDIADWQGLDTVFRRYFPASPPVRAVVGVADLPEGTRVHLSAVAWRGSDGGSSD